MGRHRHAILVGGCLLAALILSHGVMFAAPHSTGLRTFLAMILPFMLGVFGRSLAVDMGPFVGACAASGAVFWGGIGAPNGERGLLLFVLYFCITGHVGWLIFGDLYLGRRR
jgi:hypothetical protein